jgi:hypothetical protein
VGQPIDRPLGLHCLLYLVADRICEPQSPGGVSVAERYITSDDGRAREVGWYLTFRAIKTARRARVSVPCRPTVQVRQMELASNLLLAALLECRDAGRVELRLAESRWWKGMFGPTNRALVRARPGLALDGLCGQILNQLERIGDQGAGSLFRGMSHLGLTALHGGGWVIEKVKTELTDRGYMRRTTERARFARMRTKFIVDDCEQIQSLAEDCASAVDRWQRAWAADPQRHVAV